MNLVLSSKANNKRNIFGHHLLAIHFIRKRNVQESSKFCDHFIMNLVLFYKQKDEWIKEKRDYNNYN